MNGSNSILAGVKTKAKTAAKRAAKTLPVSAKTTRPQAAQGDYKLILLKDLQPSPSNPRRRIDEKAIESLAESIRTQGVLEPLIVRQTSKKYEIVCGERRYRAAKVAALKEGIPCLVRTLLDEQVLDIQIHENLHREDIHPMDEAYGYKFLQEKLGCNISELALRVGKPEGYVLNRLKLNMLIEEAQKDLDDGHLPLTYALEIAKYTPEIQEILFSEAYRKEHRYEEGEYVLVPIKGRTIPLKAFTDWINTNIHRRLSLAPFNPKAADLRSDGLACTKCPDRTGAAVSLFEPNQIGKKDACLNPVCYLQKLATHVQVRRQKLAEIGKVEPSEVPLVKSFCYSDGEDFLGTESARVIDSKRGGRVKACKHAISGIDIEADNYGRDVQVCLKSSGCKTHWPGSKDSSNDSAKGKSPEEEIAERLETHRARREEIWNAKVAGAVRVRVFKQAAESFEKKFRIAEVGTDFLFQLIARFWSMSASGDSNNLNGVVRHLVAEWEEGKSEKGDTTLALNGSVPIESLRKLERGMLFRILFLLIHGHKGAIGYGNNYVSQTEVRELAAEFNVDYSLIDAEVRLDLSSKKHRQAHEIYHDAVREKKTASIPQLYSSEWKAID